MDEHRNAFKITAAVLGYKSTVSGEIICSSKGELEVQIFRVSMRDHPQKQKVNHKTI